MATLGPVARGQPIDRPDASLSERDIGVITLAPRPGTHWMHSHQGMQEQQLMAAPLIIRDASRGADEQEVVLMLHDFSFRSPEEIFAGLRKPTPSAATTMSGMPAKPTQAKPMQGMAMNTPGMAGGAMPGAAGMTRGWATANAIRWPPSGTASRCFNHWTRSPPPVLGSYADPHRSIGRQPGGAPPFVEDARIIFKRGAGGWVQQRHAVER